MDQNYFDELLREMMFLSNGQKNRENLFQIFNDRNSFETRNYFNGTTSIVFI